jgi:hypothetical protein
MSANAAAAIAAGNSNFRVLSSNVYRKGIDY